MLHRAFSLILVRFAGPHSALVELDAILGRISEDHRANAPVADRQSCIPLDRGLAIPKQMVGIRHLAGKRPGRHKGQNNNAQEH
jgi:hypothetical protein